ncbi:MAG TPA: TIM-barrel domain-containing protein, partial [Candidatus Polarisedimenticolia bacterium]|nr:TIM-barrel domain-containing protein [Candidatus Polarisedimenticolia bacterium]
MNRRAARAGALLAAAILPGLTACKGGAPPTHEAPGVVRAGHARFTVITPECIRIEYSAEDRFIDAPSMLAADRVEPSRKLVDLGEPRAVVPSAPRFRVEHQGRTTLIDTGRIRLFWLDDGAPPGRANLRALIAGGEAPIEWSPGAKSARNLGGALRGLGAARGRVDLGEGLLSRDGFYLLDDSKGPLLTRGGWVEARPADSGTDWYLFGYGLDYPAALRALALLSGPAPLPRRPWLGSWYSRYWPHTSDDFRRIVGEYRRERFPLDVVVLDTDWHREGWTGWSWDRRLLPDAEDLLAWMHARGLLVTLNLHPSDGVAPHEDAYPAFMRALGADPSGRRTLPFDDTDRIYMDALFAQVQTPLERAGADFFWIDWQQAPNTRVAGLTHLAWLNEIYYRRSERDGHRGQILSRYAGPGDQRHAGHFSGDAFALWPVLRFEVPATAAASNSGCFFWSHDIGG